MEYDICFPDYDNGILGIAVSILKSYGIPSEHKSLPLLDRVLQKNYKNVIFMVFDGMGAYILDKHLPKDSFLQRHKVADLSSVFPSTTVAATRTMCTGLTPKEHGWIGWQCYFSEFDKYIELFRNTDYYTKEKIDIPPMEKGLLAYENISQKIEKATNGKVVVDDIYPAFRIGGVKNVEEMFAKLKRVCKNSKKNFIQTYWNEPDSSMHNNGCGHQSIKDILQNIDENIAVIPKEFENSLFIITADHGQLDIEEDIFLNEISELDECLLRAPSMEVRTVSFYIKPDKMEVFKERFEKLFHKDFLLLAKEDYIAKFLGEGNPHSRIASFVGDFVAIAITNKTLQYKTPETLNVNLYKGHHAGLTAMEMTVPLIIVET